MIAQAKGIDSGRTIEGNLMKVRWHGSEEYSLAIQVIDGRNNSAYKYDPKTLKYSFDSGESFHSEHEIDYALRTMAISDSGFNFGEEDE